MPKDSITFIWHGKDYRGKSAHGPSRTRDEDSLRTSLRQQGIKLIHAETAPPVLQQLMNIAIRRFSLTSKLRTQHRVKKSDISHILQQLTMLLQAGIPILQCFNTLNHGQKKPAIRHLLTAIKKELESGISLADSLRRQGNNFDPILCNLIALGEHSGSLNRVLEKIVQHRSKLEELQRNIRRALIYPCTILTPLMQDMVRTGEESGSLLQLLNNLSEIYENELEQWVAGMNSLLEPLIISLLGLIVGSLVLAMYLPIFKLSSII